VPVLQGTDVKNQGSFRAEIHEDAFDYLTMIDQQHEDTLSRAVRLPDSFDPNVYNMELPTPVASQAIGFNATGTGLSLLGSLGGVAHTAYIDTLLDDINAAAARSTLGLADISATLKLAQLLVGHTAVVDIGVTPSLEVIGDAVGALMGVAEFSASSASGQLLFAKSRHATLGSHTLVLNGDNLGLINFQGSDGTDFAQAAYILAQVDGAPGNNDMPGRLIFATSPDGTQVGVERMRIDSVGLVSVTGALTVNGATTTPTSATPQAATSGTFRDFTGIPSWVKRITVMVDGLSTSGTSNLALQIGDAGGIETAGYAGSADSVGKFGHPGRGVVYRWISSHYRCRSGKHLFGAVHPESSGRRD
jgi:hypothetical protein